MLHGLVQATRPTGSDHFVLLGCVVIYGWVVGVAVLGEWQTMGAGARWAVASWEAWAEEEFLD